MKKKAPVTVKETKLTPIETADKTANRLLAEINEKNLKVLSTSNLLLLTNRLLKHLRSRPEITRAS